MIIRAVGPVGIRMRIGIIMAVMMYDGSAVSVADIPSIARRGYRNIGWYISGLIPDSGSINGMGRGIRQIRIGIIWW